jgi:hypothetical protein
MRFSSPFDREKAGVVVASGVEGDSSWTAGVFFQAIFSAHAACSESIIHVERVK